MLFGSSLRKNNGDNHTVKTESLTEDKDQDHSDEDLFLLGISSDSSISDNSNSETGGLQTKFKLQKVGLTSDERPQQSPEARCLYPLA